MATDKPILLSPFTLAGLELRNRVVMPPMGTRHAARGLVTPADLQWHADRAAGGVGLIITGGTFVHETSILRGNLGLEAWRRDAIPTLRARADAIHDGGAKVIAQILHLGRETTEGQAELAPVAPSAVRSVREAFAPHALSSTEIEDIIHGFIVSAVNMQEAGHDGVEIHGAHGYLIAQFLSAQVNQRTDQYGGATPTERAEFLRQVLQGVRGECGPGFVVGLRLSAHEETAEGIQLHETLELAKHLELTRLIDYLSITRGVRNAYVKDNSWAWGVAVSEAQAVKAVTSLPVMVTGRITTPAQGEEVLSGGSADLIGVGRGLIADPQWAAKAAGTTPGRIRPCIGFVQDCRMSHGGATCGVNAASGREREFGLAVSQPSSSGHLVVVGGGPGGLEAARVATERGMTVTLFEREAGLGGQLLRAGRGPHRGEFVGFIEYEEAELARLGVEVRLGVEADVELLRGLDPQAVLVASGAEYGSVQIPGATSANSLSVWELFDGSVREFPEHVVVADDGTGYWAPLSAAELAATSGAVVTFATPAAAVAATIPLESSAGLHRRLRGAGVRYAPFSAVDRMESGGVIVRDTVTGKESVVAADLLILQTTPTATGDRLATALRSVGVDVHVIGDALTPRRISHAVYEANRALDQLIGAGAAPPLPPVFQSS